MPQQNRRPLIRTDLAACPTGQQLRPLLSSQYGTGPSEDQHGSLPILECPVVVLMGTDANRASTSTTSQGLTERTVPGLEYRTA